ncbi:AAA family ATPase [Methanobrevibacter olleyae]|uniref:MoxR-like ATPase n=1 Tax=Methanobrevibacter olleyae TaxID=294671 RepID=A0A126QY99_METOL|nr:MoxR family ATPase [Methanobrevibacter olleyae]AMK14784.1 MoxR-like ATPase [Methanobrevibacter olleyae]
MTDEELTINEIEKKLESTGYISNNEISTAVFLSLSLNKPVLIEGPPGVGKTELAKAVAQSLGRDFFRIQCYEGITFEQIVGEWNYQKQLLHLEAFKGSKKGEDSIFENDFFIRRPLLTSFMNNNPSLLLIDEIDKADEEVESFLLQALGEKQITVNDLGTFDLQNDLVVMLTSNAQRNLLEETKDRCLFLYISYPSVEREIAIVKARLPDAENGLVKKVVNIVQRIRSFNLNKKPSVRASIDWVHSVMHLDKDYKNVDGALQESIGVAIKTEPDKAKVMKEIFNNEFVND